jgi:hypothetical protein
VLTTANIVTNAPTTITAMFVTAERIVVLLGVPDDNSNFDPLLVKWSDQENNQTWTETASNLAGSYRLTAGSRIVGGIVVNGENVIFTDAAAYLMRYTGDPDSVYRFDPIGNIGLLGPNCAAVVGGILHWVSPQIALYRYAGGGPMQMISNVFRDIRENHAWSQQDKAYLTTNKANNEVWFFYADIRDGNEVSRYSIYNIETGKEAVGTFDRTTWFDAGIFQYPVSVSDDGVISYQEKGETDNGGSRSWSLKTAYFDADDGDKHVLITGMHSDHEDLSGGYRVTIRTQHEDVKGQTTRTFGPFAVSNSDRRIPIRAVGQRIQVEFNGTDSPAWWRMGAFKLDIRPTGRRR